MSTVIGTKFHAVDFHIHTPESTDYKDKQCTPDDIITASVEAGLSAIAITDHNSIGWIEKLQMAGESSDIVVFPGIEITTQGGHVIALFDPSTSLDVLEEVLIESGIPKNKWGREDALGGEINSVMSIINKKEGLAIAAHADGPKGFLVANEQGQTKIRIYSNSNLAALELTSLERKNQYLDGKVGGYSRPIPCIQGSDAHSLARIGARHTLLRMHHLSLEGVRQAFAEPKLRIRLPEEWGPSQYPYINKLIVNQGFLSDQAFDFNPNLNCLIGGAGSGKSTVIEFLRFALDQISGIEHIEEDCFGKLQDLAQVGASIEVLVTTESGEQISIARRFDNNGNPISITRVSDGQPLNIDIHRIFPVHAYSQGEAISISRSPLAQLELIDKHLNLAQFRQEIQEAYQGLSEQSLGLAKLKAKTRDRDALDRAIETAQNQIDILTKELASLQEDQKSPVVTSHQLWIAERNYLTALVESFGTTQAEIEEKMDDINLSPLHVPLPIEETPNQDVLNQCRELLSQLDDIRRKAKQEMLTTLETIEKTVLTKAGSWKERYQEHDAEYQKIRIEQKATRIGKIATELEGHRNDQHRYKTELRNVQAAEQSLNKQLERRKVLLDIIQDRKARIYNLRVRKTKEFVRKIGDAIRLKVSENGNRKEYMQRVTDLMKGSRATKDTIKKLCDSIHPQELVSLLREGDIVRVDNISNIGQRWAEALLDQAKAQPEAIYSIEAVPVEDLLEISFKTGQGEYRPLEKLSTGQKATVIVLLSMVEGKHPIIFDQPEDALYTPFIFSEVVKILRREKDERQFILATHNANISVAADVDLGIILDGTATQTAVKALGGLDDKTTQDLMVLHLEGGVDAFQIRKKKYG